MWHLSVWSMIINTNFITLMKTILEWNVGNVPFSQFPFCGRIHDELSFLVFCRIFEFRKVIGDREKCKSLVPKDYPVYINKVFFPGLSSRASNLITCRFWWLSVSMFIRQRRIMTVISMKGTSSLHLSTLFLEFFLQKLSKPGRICDSSSNDPLSNWQCRLSTILKTVVFLSSLSSGLVWCLCRNRRKCHLWLLNAHNGNSVGFQVPVYSSQKVAEE